MKLVLEKPVAAIAGLSTIFDSFDGAPKYIAGGLLGAIVVGFIPIPGTPRLIAVTGGLAVAGYGAYKMFASPDTAKEVAERQYQKAQEAKETAAAVSQINTSGVGNIDTTGLPVTPGSIIDTAYLWWGNVIKDYLGTSSTEMPGVN